METKELMKKNGLNQGLIPKGDMAKEINLIAKMLTSTCGRHKPLHIF